MTAGRLVSGAVILTGGMLVAAVLSACGGQQTGNPTAGGTTTGSTTVTTPPTGRSTTVVSTSTRRIGPIRTPECATADLRLALHWDGPAAGSVYQDLVFTNTGATTCWIVGFPGVSFVTGASGQQVGAPAVRSGAEGVRVELAPGQSGYATVQQANSGDYDPATCRPTAARGLRVYPPDNRIARYVPDATTACAATELPSAQLLVRTVTTRPAA